jgi:hypothetical protein
MCDSPSTTHSSRLGGQKMKTAIKPIPNRNLTPLGDQESIASIKNEVLSAEHETPISICDLCGDLTPNSQLQNTGGNAQLCPACYMQFISIPQAFRECFWTDSARKRVLNGKSHRTHIVLRSQVCRYLQNYPCGTPASSR